MTASVAPVPLRLDLFLATWTMELEGRATSTGSIHVTVAQTDAAR
jgi:hypothetical protein